MHILGFGFCDWMKFGKNMFSIKRAAEAVKQGFQPESALAKLGVVLLIAVCGSWGVTARGEDGGKAAASQPKPLPFTGTNLSGGEFYGPKLGKKPVYSKNFIYPSAAEFDYFAGKGMNIIRIPFRWETLQPEMNQPLDAVELGRLRASVSAATGKGLVVLLDPHNYARYYDKVVGGPEVPAAALADFWGKLAAAFKDDPHVWFGLMNEPHDIPVAQWLDDANAAIAAIRAAGATNRILVPGVGWTSAGGWVKNGNDAMLGIKDSGNNYIIEVHTYLDKDNSGTHPEIVSPEVGRQRLEQFTQWCRTHHQQAFLGEFGTAASPEAAAAVENMLTYMEQSPDVWVGFTWWSAGAWWGNYMYSIEPQKVNGAVTDRPQLDYLLPHLQKR